MPHRQRIRKLTEKYNVEYIGIDATGLGLGVYQLVRSFFPAARGIRYTPEMKTAMVLKAKDTIRRGCLEYDAGATDVTQSFMSIRKTMTSSGRSATYEASRTEEASHADIAWATMHALLNEPLSPVAACSQNLFWSLIKMGKQKSRKAAAQKASKSQHLTASAPPKQQRSPLVSRCRYSISAIFWITSSASVTAMVRAAGQFLRAGKEPALCRTSQLTDLR